MTIIDELYEFSDNQSVILNDAASVLSEDVVDLGADQKDGFFASVLTSRLGEQAKPMVLLLTIETALVGAAATLQIELISRAADATITDADTIHDTKIFPALSVSGTQIVMPLSWDAYNRYLGVYYTAAGGNITAGTINAHLVEGGQLTD